MKKFEKGDILKNVLKTHPKVRFFCYDGQIYYDNSIYTELELNNFLQPRGKSILTEDGIDMVTEAGNRITMES